MLPKISESNKTQDVVRLSPDDAAAPTVDLPERKAGGPADRLDWLVSNAPRYGGAAFKLLTILVKHSNSGGTCWPSRDLLILETGLPARTLDRAIAELKTGGAMDVTQGRTVSTYRLSGASNGWQPCHQWQPSLATGGSLSLATSGKQNPSSSEPSKEPWVTGDGNAADAEPTGVTTGVYVLGFEEEGATKKCAAPPAAADAEEVAAWMATYCPNDHRQSEAAPFALRMLRDYKAHWWAAPVGTRKGGWQSHMTPEMVTAHYIDNAERWQKFRADVADKLVRGGLPAMTSTGELEREAVWCNGCQAMTGAYDVGQVMKIGGRKEVDKCLPCAGGE